MKAVKFMKCIFGKMFVNHRSRNIVESHLWDVNECYDGVNVAIQAVLFKTNVFANHHISNL